MIPRIGIGTDAHRLVEGRAMWLAGLHWPEESVGLDGHSDGDCASHALVDALFAAAAMGDIGSHFGIDEPEWAAASGLTFLTETALRLHNAGWSIGNASVQIIGNRPRLNARREQAQQVLTEAVTAPVSVSATTTDGLGLTGRGEGIAAIATALVYRHD